MLKDVLVCWDWRASIKKKRIVIGEKLIEISCTYIRCTSSKGSRHGLLELQLVGTFARCGGCIVSNTNQSVDNDITDD